MFKGFTKCSNRIVNYLSALEAKRYNHSVVLPEHAMIALLKDSNGIAYKILGQIIDPVQLQTLLENHVSTIVITEKVEETNKEYRDIESFYNIQVTIPLSKRMHQCLYRAVEEARILQLEVLDTFVLFIACCKEKNSALFQIAQGIDLSFENLCVSYHRFINYITLYENDTNTESFQTYDNTFKAPKNDTAPPATTQENILQKKMDFKKKESQNEKSDEKTKKSIKKTRKETQEDDNFQFLTDLTEKMFHQKIPMYGREKEIQGIFRVLIRHYKNNPLLIGDPGVGKSAIVEEVARRICWGEVPLSLLHARILQLDIAAMTAGTRFRGDFEDRLCKVIEYIQRQSKITPTIVFIDEFHHLIGAGLSVETTMDAAGILKPALARGQLCCIGATTTEEYQKHIEHDRAFARRFMPITIDELSEENTFRALQTIKKTFEDKHSVHFEDAALKEIIRLTQNYMFDRKLPDKAIDMLDEVGSFYKLQKTESSPELTHLYQSMHALLEQAEQTIDTFKLNANTIRKVQDYPMPVSHGKKHDEDTKKNTIAICKKITKTNNKLHNIITRRTSLQNALKVLVNHTRLSINASHVQNVVSNITGIPTDRMDIKQASLMKRLPENLKKQIIGQDHSIDALVSAIRRNAVGLRDERRPVGSFLFLGSTGVGKTHTARELAKHLFGSERMLTRFDMSDFVESHTVSKLIGAPPGYVGFENGGILVKSVRSKPRQILLFDEIEKAHNKIFDIFLQIFEDGTLQGPRGEVADFRHCIIIMTSNIGADELFAKKSMGFGEAHKEETIHAPLPDNAKIEALLTETFRPEFIHRIDETVCFHPLTHDMVDKIIETMLVPLHKSLNKQDIMLMVTPSAKALLQSKYFRSEAGARSIRKGIRAIEDIITDALLEGTIGKNSTICVLSHDNAFYIEQSHEDMLQDDDAEALLNEEPLAVS